MIREPDKGQSTRTLRPRGQLVPYMVYKTGIFLQFEEDWTYPVIQTDETEKCVTRVVKKRTCKSCE